MSLEAVAADSGDGSMGLEAYARATLGSLGDAGGGGGNSGDGEDGTVGPDGMDPDFNRRDACGDGSDGNGVEDFSLLESRAVQHRKSGHSTNLPCALKTAERV
jgi:hypothetical protein